MQGCHSGGKIKVPTAGETVSSLRRETSTRDMYFPGVQQPTNLLEPDVLVKAESFAGLQIQCRTQQTAEKWSCEREEDQSSLSLVLRLGTISLHQPRDLSCPARNNKQAACGHHAIDRYLGHERCDGGSWNKKHKWRLLAITSPVRLVHS
ncbi:hypothetical protein JOB18_045862 [Solea senegalensis]|uniref:Uncharacterized protein n=1 Tax=Solea senegalensis TaxID=28829 RepID=A0AAV6R0E1_SOLSE|nr:hypothetical protein JOB18_045862 [Solea senegalensis]